MKLITRLFALVLLTLVPVVGSELYNEAEARAQREEQGKEQALRLVRVLANQQSKMIESAHQLLTALGKMPSLRNRNAVSCNAFLSDLVSAYPEYPSFVSIDLTGHVICASGEMKPGDYLGDRPYFRTALETHAFTFGEFEAASPQQQMVIHFAQPFQDADGNIAGVAAAALSLDWLNHEIEQSPLPPKATVSLIDRQGTIVARHPGQDQFVGTKVSANSHAYLLSGNEGVLEAPGFDRIVRIFSYAPVPGALRGLTVSVGLDKAELLQGAALADRRDLIAIAGSSVLALLLAALGARAFINRPIKALLDTAECWRQGDLNARVHFPKTGSEFSRLGNAFNEMAAAISMREQEQERRVEERTEALKGAMEAQQAAEAALQESRKMETIGRLTGGVAHDFNNLLAAIVGNMELARVRLGPDHPAVIRIDAATQSANRGAALVQQLLAFARRQNLRPEIVDMNATIDQARDMLQRLLRSDVVIETSLFAEAWLVRVDPGQLEAAILNLAINARDAMPSGGTLRVATANARLTGHNTKLGLKGDFVALTVSDTGTGIPPDILEKVFDPFFTTKETGAGSGLGLSMVHGFARQSSGSVLIESIVGQGTSVTLYLPRTRRAAKPAIKAAEEPIAGQGTVLLVDDDPEVLSVNAELLGLTGYTVVTARNAAEAIAEFAQEGRRFDILVTDLVLAGGRNGIELAGFIRTQRPKLPVLLITGYSEELLNEAMADKMPVLVKPFDHVTLARSVQQAIRRAAPRTTRIARAIVLDKA